MTKKTKARHTRRVARRAQIKTAKSVELIHIDCSSAVEITAAVHDDDEKKIPSFKMIAYTGGIITESGYQTPLVIDLAGMSIPEGGVPILMAHDKTQIIGHSTDIPKTVDNLSAEGVISGVGQAAQDVVASAANGFPWGASVGASPGRLVELQAGEKRKINGNNVAGPLLVAETSVLREISFTAFPADANSAATVAATASFREKTKMDRNFTKWLTAKGFDVEDLSAEQEVTLQAMHNEDIAAKAKEEGANVPSADEIKAELRKEAAAEATRIRGITKVCASHNNPTIDLEDDTKVDLCAHAIETEFSVEKTELHAMRSVRSSNVAIHTSSHDSSCTLQALQGAMVLAAGVELDAKCFDTAGGRSMEGIPKFLRLGINDDARQQAMEDAHQFSDMSALDILAEAVRLDGNVAPRSRKALIKAAFSGSSLDSVFTSSVSASLLSTYQQSEDTTGGWVSEVDVPDFKSNERELLAKGPDLDLLPRGQTAQHLSRSDVEESYKVHRYAKQFVVDEQDIIDDRLGALRQTPAEMGQAAARVRPDLVYSILFANANLSDGTALFVAGHGNVQTSSGLSSATLRAAIESIMTQQDNSVNLNLRASHLIVPAGLVHTAWELVNSSQLLTTGTTDAVQGSSNPLTVHNLSVVADARLDNGVTDPLSGTVHAGSATTWYMAAAMGHTIEVGYIRGMGRSPSVRSEVLTGGTWGLSWDIKLDVGAKALDFRSLNQATA